VVADLHAGGSTVSSHRGRFINFRDSYFTQGRFHTAENFSRGRVFTSKAEIPERFGSKKAQEAGAAI